ncbi:hypothetical protein Shyhy01_30620 [Streptomyces hygroscopicus subsp. hygroscopicus]|nr:hypothetical protein Shyhy01_30620 [Streptomyces hygroscopicus subsp. hygroscopicus]
MVSMQRSAPEPSSLSFGTTVRPSAFTFRARASRAPGRVLLPGGKPVPITRSPAPSRSSGSWPEALLVAIFFGVPVNVVLAPAQSVTVTG